jgi:hypothetical protein
MGAAKILAVDDEADFELLMRSLSRTLPTNVPRPTDFDRLNCGSA